MEPGACWTGRTFILRHPIALPPVPLRREWGRVAKGRRLVGPATVKLLPHCRLGGERSIVSVASCRPCLFLGPPGVRRALGRLRCSVAHQWGSLYRRRVWARSLRRYFPCMRVQLVERLLETALELVKTSTVRAAQKLKLVVLFGGHNSGREMSSLRVVDSGNKNNF